MNRRKEVRPMRIWNGVSRSRAIVWLMPAFALLLAACGNGGKPGY